MTAKWKREETLSHHKHYRWIILGLCSSLLFYKYILSLSPSIMVDDLMEQFKVTGAQLGNLAATFFYTYTIVQLFSGILLDKFGTRFIAGFSIFVAALGAYIFAQTNSLAWATVARGMMGFGVSFATVTYFKLSAAWFRVDQLAFVGGLLATAVMVGAVFGQAPLAWLLAHTSWRFVLEFCSALGVLIAVLFLTFARARPEMPENTILQQRHTQLPKAGWKEIKATLKNPQNWLLMLYSGLAFSPLSAVGGLWGNPFLQEAYGLSITQAAGLTSLLFIGLGLGGPLLGLLSDKLGNRLGVMKCWVLVSLFSLLGFVYLPGLPVGAVGILLFMLGFSTGAFMLGFTVGTQINPIMLAGTTIALINTGDSVFESFTEPMLGKILDLSGHGYTQEGLRYFTVHDYYWAFLPLAFYYIVALAALFFIKEPEGC